MQPSSRKHARQDVERGPAHLSRQRPPRARTIAPRGKARRGSGALAQLATGRIADAWLSRVAAIPGCRAPYDLLPGRRTHCYVGTVAEGDWGAFSGLV